MARASTHTLLSLDRFAEIMGIAGPHFAGAETLPYFPYSGRCNDLWYQYQWQSHDRVSREDLAQAISDVELELAEAVGFWPAPKFIAQEVHPYPKYYRPEQLSKIGQTRFRRGFPNQTFNAATGADDRPKAINLDWGKFIQAGQRAITAIDTATVAGGTLTYSDDDGDSFAETVTIVLPTTLTSECEIKVFYTGEIDPEYEIRPARSIVISGGNVTLRFWTWQFIDPDLWEFFPTADGNTPIDITNPPTNLLTSVDVAREYVNSAVESAQFYWEPDVTCQACGGSGCTTCMLSSQTGCIHPRNVGNSSVVANPATYDEDSGTWTPANFAECIDPDIVKVWYYAGDIQNRYLSGLSCNPMSPFWEKTIAYMAIARLERPFCSCENLEALVDQMRVDLSASDKNVRRFVTPDVMSSPFGHYRGEVFAWRRVKNFVRKRPRMAIVN